jgi:hypothetical protein
MMPMTVISPEASQRISVFAGLVTMGVSFFVSVSAYAQVAGARLSRRVTGSSGTIVPQTQTSISISAVANADGFYSAPNLIAGSHEVSVSAPGIATTVQGRVNLTVGAEQVLDLIFHMGQVSQKFEVSNSGSQVELASLGVGVVLGSSTEIELTGILRNDEDGGLAFSGAGVLIA